jgi:hypothetical protein
VHCPGCDFCRLPPDHGPVLPARASELTPALPVLGCFALDVIFVCLPVWRWRALAASLSQAPRNAKEIAGGGEPIRERYKFNLCQRQ